jgi:hypothetical protein
MSDDVLDAAQALVDSLYVSGDLSVDQADAITAGLGTAQDERDQALADALALRAALAWYADIGNYNETEAPGTLDPQAGSWHVDGGRRARAALEAQKASRQ